MGEGGERVCTRREFLGALGAGAPILYSALAAPGCVGVSRPTVPVAGHGEVRTTTLSPPRGEVRTTTLSPPRGKGARGQRPGRRPNVVIVITDDQGYGDLGCHGNPLIQTPAMDALHARSVRFTNFHVAPTCAPSRAGLMTGRYCNRTGVWHTIMGRSLLRRDEVTMADVFSAAGYETGIFGKWHLGDNYPFRPQDRGFGEVLVHGGGGIGQTPDYWGNDYFDDTYFHNGRPEEFRGYCTDVFFENAMRFIEGNRNRPFFCYIPTNAPHSPFNVPEKYSDLYGGQDVPDARFYGMITNIDENLGRLTRQLETLGLEENTILIFMTDNGTAAGWRRGRGWGAGMRGTKGSEYDGGHRVPCFIRWPIGGVGGGPAGGRDVHRLAACIDILPTLIDFCGLEKPEGVNFDGASVAPLVGGEETEWPDRTLVVDSQRIEHPQKWRKCAVMTDRWRLVNGRELYDMGSDPGQRRDVAGENPAVVERLRAAYEEWWADTSERFDEYCEIVLGSDRENPSRLTCHDWHGRSVPWNQKSIRDGRKGNGFWAVEIERSGRYEFALRRWPEELNAPITSGFPGGKAVAATSARLKIADVDMTKPVPPPSPNGAPAVTFQVDLKAGKTRLQTWFENDREAPRGAYYVYVRRLP